MFVHNRICAYKVVQTYRRDVILSLHISTIKEEDYGYIRGP